MSWGSALHNLVKPEKMGVARASLILAFSAILSNILGLARNIVFYRVVPTSELDIYNAAFRLPDLLFNVLILGAISSAFIPVLSEILSKKGKEEGWKLTNQLLTWLTLVFGLVAATLFIFMPKLMPFIVPGFDADRLTQSIFISRILLLQSIFFAWSWTIGGLLNAQRQFKTYALAPLLYNGSIIIGGFFAAHYGITAIAISVVIGAILHFAIQFSEVRSTGFKIHVHFAWNHQLKEILTLMIPRSISQGMTQIILIAYTALGSGLLPGSIAIFSGMNDLQTTPTMVITNSLAIAFFPMLTEHVQSKRHIEADALITKTMRTTLYLLVPVVIIGYILRAQIVRLYFGIGGANWELTTLAIDTFTWFLVGIIPTALVVLWLRIYYSLKDTRTPLFFAIINGIVSIGLATFFIRNGGSVASLAAANSIGAIVYAILLAGGLYRRGLNPFPLQAVSTLMITTSASVVLAGMTWGVLYGIDHIYGISSFVSTRIIIGLLIQFLAAASVAVIGYYYFSKWWQLEELQWLKKSVLSKRS